MYYATLPWSMDVVRADDHACGRPAGQPDSMEWETFDDAAGATRMLLCSTPGACAIASHLSLSELAFSIAKPLSLTHRRSDGLTVRLMDGVRPLECCCCWIAT